MGETTAQQDVPLVLVVDDDKAVRLLLRRVLEPGGYVVEEADDGVQALSACERLRPDLVLLDILMPRMDGFATCTRLRALPGGNRTPVLMVTALQDKEAIDRAFEAGATDYITKPIHLDVLRHRVAHLLRARRAEEALRASEAKYRELVQNANSIIVRMDTQGRVTFFNEFAQNFFGYAEDEILGRDVVGMIVPEREASGRDLATMIQDIVQYPEQYAANENENVRRNGERVWVAWTNKAILDEEGRVTGILSIGNDITERKRLEEQMRQQDRLASIGQLAGGIAHDFNNVLTGITLSAQMLLGRPDLSRDLVPDLESILADAQQAAHLVQQILDFSRRSFFETRPMDLDHFVQESAVMLRRTLPESVSLLLEVGRGQCVVDADPVRMQQMLMNLATNARDAMPEGGELRIGLSRMQVRPGEEPPVADMGTGEWVCLAVSDTGSGMSPDVVSHLFEPFFTTKPVGQGTGMGLAQAHGIVKQHKGHIGIETKMGQGTTFRIYFPARDGVPEAERAPQEKATLAAPERKRATILLVEDEDRVRKLGRKALELLGYRVLTAVDGRDALKVYRSADRVNLVITDMVMPEMGGRELMRELKKINPRVKGLVITGYALADDLEELREEGILDVIHKPLDVGTLEGVVRWALDGE